MKIIKNDAELRLSEILKILEADHLSWRVQYVALARLGSVSVSAPLVSMLLGLIIHRLADASGYAVITARNNVMIIGNAVPKKMLDDIAEEFIQHVPQELLTKHGAGLVSLIDLSTMAGWNSFLALTETEISHAPPHFKKARTPKADAVTVKPALPKPRTLPDEAIQRLFAAGLECRQKRDKPCVLLVEDDPVSLLIARKALERTFTIQTAATAAEARIAYATHAPDIVFLDIGLPDHSGHDVLSDFLAIDSEAYVVMLSGNSFHQDIVRAVKAGAKGFVGKPFARAKLLHYIAQSPHCGHNLLPSMLN